MSKPSLVAALLVGGLALSGATPARASEVTVPGGVLDIGISGRHPVLSDEDLVGWVIGAGRAVASYYGTFPVPRVAVLIHVGGRGAVSGGRTEGRGEPSIRIRVGDDATARDLSESWILVHEMVHLALPSVNGHAWLEEGLATYVEPLVRARAGLAPADEIWTWLVWGIPKGLASARGVSLDEARGHSATYWGGAAFCFLADVEIRKRTNNRFSLDDALRGIVRAGGEVTRSWPIEKVLSEGDRATGVPVLTELYERMGKAPMPEKVDLADLWKRLGVASAGERIVYDDAAPLSAVRRGITTGS